MKKHERPAAESPEPRENDASSRGRSAGGRALQAPYAEEKRSLRFLDSSPGVLIETRLVDGFTATGGVS